MTEKHLRDLYDARPFQPFRLILADGSEVPVERAEWMLISLSGAVVHVFRADESYLIIDLPLVIAIEVPAPRLPAASP